MQYHPRITMCSFVLHEGTIPSIFARRSTHRASTFDGTWVLYPGFAIFGRCRSGILDSRCSIDPQWSYFEFFYTSNRRSWAPQRTSIFDIPWILDPGDLLSVNRGPAIFERSCEPGPAMIDRPSILDLRSPCEGRRSKIQIRSERDAPGPIKG